MRPARGRPQGLPSCGTILYTVLSLSNTNGSEGYFITQDAICRGGYEVDMFLYGHLQQFADNADFYLMQESIKHIQNLMDEE